MIRNFVTSFAALAALCLAGCEAGSPEVVDPRAGIKTVGGEDPSLEPEVPAPAEEPVVVDTDPSDDWELCLKYKMFEGKWWSVEFENGYNFKYPANKPSSIFTCTPVPEHAACIVKFGGLGEIEAPADGDLPIVSEVVHTEKYDPVYDETTIRDVWFEVTLEPCSNKVVPGHPVYEETCTVRRAYENGNLSPDWQWGWWSKAAAN